MRSHRLGRNLSSGPPLNSSAVQLVSSFQECMNMVPSGVQHMPPPLQCGLVNTAPS
uniref:Uncharacterized protein n=1 Tax=Monodelphis domestica TaxID=13616 RepID=A0A5F8G526_MONDO